MLSDNEQRRLAEIEASLADEDPSFTGRFGSSQWHRPASLRRYAAIITAIAGVSTTVVGFAVGVIAISVTGLTVLGIAGGILTWPQARRQRY